MSQKSAKPIIYKQDLKHFSGLELVNAQMLSTQDSLEVAPKNITASAASSSTATGSTARRSVHQEMSMPVHMASEVNTVFKQMGRGAKKHSLETEPSFFAHAEPTGNDGLQAAVVSDGVDGGRLTATETLVASSSAPPTGKAPSPARGPGFRSSHSIGITGVSSASSSTNNVRSGSLSEDASVARKRQSPVAQTSSLVSTKSAGAATSTTTEHAATTLSQSVPATTTILNLEENRVTIQVPGVQNTASVIHRNQQHSPVVKQSSIDKGKH